MCNCCCFVDCSTVLTDSVVIFFIWIAIICLIILRLVRRTHYSALNSCFSFSSGMMWISTLACTIKPKIIWSLNPVVVIPPRSKLRWKHLMILIICLYNRMIRHLVVIIIDLMSLLVLWWIVILVIVVWRCSISLLSKFLNNSERIDSWIRMVNGSLLI